MLPALASAHILDEYEQATRIALAKDHVTLKLRLTAGVEIASQVFALIDTNKDGQLSKVEFMAAAPQTAGTPNGAALLTQLDKNKDGKITPDEYEAPVLARFDALDTNHDGTLSATERQAAAAQAQRKR